MQTNYACLPVWCKSYISGSRKVQGYKLWLTSYIIARIYFTKSQKKGNLATDNELLTVITQWHEKGTNCYAWKIFFGELAPHLQNEINNPREYWCHLVL